MLCYLFVQYFHNAFYLESYVPNYRQNIPTVYTYSIYRQYSLQYMPTYQFICSTYLNKTFQALQRFVMTENLQSPERSVSQKEVKRNECLPVSVGVLNPKNPSVENFVLFKFFEKISNTFFKKKKKTRQNTKTVLKQTDHLFIFLICSTPLSLLTSLTPSAFSTSLFLSIFLLFQHFQLSNSLNSSNTFNSVNSFNFFIYFFLRSQLP